MMSDLPKVLHEVCGQPMLAHVVAACRLAGVDRIVVVVGHGKELVKKRFDSDSDITWVEQVEQKGTGHAVSCCREALSGFEGNLLVIAGDMPLVRRGTLAMLLESREASGDGLTMASTMLDDPTGYGRIIRDEDGELVAIVEDRDCSASQRAVQEVNPSYYCFDAASMFDALDKVEPDSGTGEYYLTAVVDTLRAAGRSVSVATSVPAEDALGVNSRLDLSRVNRVMQDRVQTMLMSEGVTIVDPDNTWIESDAQVGLDTVVFPFTFVGTGASIGERCRVGPFAYVERGRKVNDGEIVGSSGLGVNA